MTLSNKCYPILSPSYTSHIDKRETHEAHFDKNNVHSPSHESHPSEKELKRAERQNAQLQLLNTQNIRLKRSDEKPTIISAVDLLPQHESSDAESVLSEDIFSESSSHYSDFEILPIGSRPNNRTTQAGVFQWVPTLLPNNRFIYSSVRAVDNYSLRRLVTHIENHFHDNKPIFILSGVHGKHSGNHWKFDNDTETSMRMPHSNQGTRNFFSIDQEFFRNNPRVTVHNVSGMSEDDYRNLINNNDAHIIVGYCYSRNDAVLRNILHFDRTDVYETNSSDAMSENTATEQPSTSQASSSGFKRGRFHDEL